MRTCVCQVLYEVYFIFYKKALKTETGMPKHPCSCFQEFWRDLYKKHIISFHPASLQLRPIHRFCVQETIGKRRAAAVQQDAPASSSSGKDAELRQTPSQHRLKIRMIPSPPFEPHKLCLFVRRNNKKRKFSFGSGVRAGQIWGAV